MTSVVMEEIPDRVTLAVDISNCRGQCVGCHSPFLKEDIGLFRVSVRSKRGTSAYRLAKRYFHGGGHEQASGGKLFFPEDIADASLAGSYIEKVVNEYFESED